MRTPLFLWLLTLQCAVTLAQSTPPEKRLRVGITGGKTLLGTYRQEVPWEAAGGGFAGLDVSFAFTQEDPNFTLRLQPGWEVYRQQKTYGLHTRDSGRYRIVSNSLNIPALIRLAVPAGNRIRPFLEIGANYKISIKNHYQSTRVSCGFARCSGLTFEGDLQPEGRRNQVNVLVGVGAEFYWGGVTIPVGVRLNEGLGTYALRGQLDSGTSFPLADLRTRTLQVVTGITF